jgi:hypothetical protein
MHTRTCRVCPPEPRPWHRRAAPVAAAQPAQAQVLTNSLCLLQRVPCWQQRQVPSVPHRSAPPQGPPAATAGWPKRQASVIICGGDLRALEPSLGLGLGDGLLAGVVVALVTGGGRLLPLVLDLGGGRLLPLPALPVLLLHTRPQVLLRTCTGEEKGVTAGQESMQGCGGGRAAAGKAGTAVGSCAGQHAEL